MIQLEPGTVLEKEYKGKKIKVKVLKDGSFLYDSKNYESRGDLMKAITKGKTAQFTTFFALGKEEANGTEKKAKIKKVTEEITESTSHAGTLELVIREIVREEIKSFFRTDS